MATKNYRANGKKNKKGKQNVKIIISSMTIPTLISFPG